MVVAMHMSDGLVNAPTSLAFGLFAVLVLAVAVSRARADLDDRTAPMAGLVTAFVFAVQMINFPILPGASGHLLGGALVAILVGPWVGTLCIAIVLLVQGVLFADGGLTALGMNITNMAIVGVFTGYLVARSLRRVRAAAAGRGLLAVAFIAAFVNTVVASLAFVLEYAIGGAGGASLGTVFALDGRPARADRHRRRADHRGDRRSRSRHPAGPHLPPAPAGARAARPPGAHA